MDGVHLSNTLNLSSDCIAHCHTYGLLQMLFIIFLRYSKTCLKRSLKTKTKIGCQDRLSLNACQKYCRMLQENILQYVRPSFSYHLSLRLLFCLFLSGRLRQVFLYVEDGLKPSQAYDEVNKTSKSLPGQKFTPRLDRSHLRLRRHDLSCVKCSVLADILMK